MRLPVDFRFFTARARLAVFFGYAPRFFADKVPDGLLDAINAPSRLPVFDLSFYYYVLVDFASLR